MREHTRPPRVMLVPAEGPDRLEDIRGLFLEYAASLEVDLCFQGFEAELATLPGRYAPPDGALILALVDGQVAGCVALRRIEQDVCEIKRLFVREAYRGLGLGRALVGRAVTEAQTRHYRLMRLDTLPSMGAALALYEAMGFVATDPYVHNPIEGARYLELDLSRA
jgi:GNAT superfamily N-acetyltransferase